MRVLVASLFVPREQNILWLSSILINRRRISDIVMVGKLHDSALMDVLLQGIYKLGIRILHVSADKVVTPRGEALKTLLVSVRSYVEENELGGNFGVLFFDDDRLLGEYDLARMLDLAEPDMGVIAWPSDISDRKVLGRFGVDPGGAFVPWKYVDVMCHDEEFLRVVSRIVSGGDESAMDWYLRRMGCGFNIYSQGILHARTASEYDKWRNRTRESMERVFQRAPTITSTLEFEKMLEEEGRFDAI